MNAQKRNGIAGGGNWIVDRVKTVDALPSKGMLANIVSESVSSGGAPANVLEDLARLGASFPLTGVGVVGDDEDGKFIRSRFEALGVDITHIHTAGSAHTSYTDVMSEQGTGDRSFFHHRGANSLFGPEHILINKLECRIFHLGYLLLLDRLDEQDKEYGTQAARLLCALQKMGIKTSVDVVSEEGERFSTIVPPALPYIDYLILNEIEAGKVTGIQTRTEKGSLDKSALIDSAESLMEMGSMDLVAIHAPEGVYMHGVDGTEFSLGSLDLPSGYIKGATGAGDAFCAGMLYGIHQDLTPEECLRLGTCAAAACLSKEDAGSGLMPLEDVLKLGEQFSFRDPPV